MSDATPSLHLGAAYLELTAEPEVPNDIDPGAGGFVWMRTRTTYHSVYSPHSLRLAVVTDLLEQGEDIHDVALLGPVTSASTLTRNRSQPPRRPSLMASRESLRRLPSSTSVTLDPMRTADGNDNLGHAMPTKCEWSGIKFAAGFLVFYAVVSWSYYHPDKPAWAAVRVSVAAVSVAVYFLLRRTFGDPYSDISDNGLSLLVAVATFFGGTWNMGALVGVPLPGHPLEAFAFEAPVELFVFDSDGSTRGTLTTGELRKWNEEFSGYEDDTYVETFYALDSLQLPGGPRVTLDDAQLDGENLMNRHLVVLPSGRSVHVRLSGRAP